MIIVIDDEGVIFVGEREREREVGNDFQSNVLVEHSVVFNVSDCLSFENIKHKKEAGISIIWLICSCFYMYGCENRVKVLTREKEKT